MILKKDGFKTALVIIPHQDDEINLMGGLLPLLIENNIDVHFIYMTNGDVFFNGKVRMVEALMALSWFGVKKGNVHFLGYPDASDRVGQSLYKSDNVVVTKYGNKTYGCDIVDDYAFLTYGKHSDYTYSNLKRDLKNCILGISPQVIFATDFDGNHDHRLLSMVFDEVINDCIQDSSIDFQPFIYKGFAYSTAFKSVDDFHQMNLKDTVKPSISNNALNTVSELDNPVFSWDSRVQFPVSSFSIGNVLHENILYMSMKEHISQCVSLRTKKILNGDKVFWERPANNLIYKADVTASSGDVKQLLDFRFFDVDDIKEMVKPLQFKYLGWTPDIDDLDKTLTIKYKSFEHVKIINLYVHTSFEEDIDAKIYINNDIVLNLKDFNQSGKKYGYAFKDGIQVETIRIVGLNDRSSLFYVEILSNDALPISYAKLKINGNFAYKFLLEGSSTSLKYEIYSHGVDISRLKCISDTAEVVLDNGECRVPRNIKHFQLLIIDEITGTIYDSVSIIRLSFLGKSLEQFSMLFDNVYIKMVHRLEKFKRSRMKKKYSFNSN